MHLFPESGGDISYFKISHRTHVFKRQHHRFTGTFLSFSRSQNSQYHHWMITECNWVYVTQLSRSTDEVVCYVLSPINMSAHILYFFLIFVYKHDFKRKSQILRRYYKFSNVSMQYDDDFILFSLNLFFIFFSIMTFVQILLFLLNAIYKSI